MALITIDPPPSRKPVHLRWIWLQLGFRPFYLLAAAFAVFAIPLWLLQRADILHLPGGLTGLLWHQHEMVFGFVSAIIIGFLFTAGRVWTGLTTPQGGRLLAFVLVWLAGRLALPIGPLWISAPIDLALLPAVAWVMFSIVWKSRSLHQLPIVAVLAILSLCNLIFYLALLQIVPFAPTLAIHAALGAIIMLIQTIASRIIPGFTANAVPQARIRKVRWLMICTHLMLGISMITIVANVTPLLTAILSCLSAVLLLANLWAWDAFATLRKPILWILHLSYAWIPIGLFLMALAEIGRIPASSAWHAFTISAMSGMIAGMITRTALGHTGRPLSAGKMEIGFYALIQAAGLVRILPPLLCPENYNLALTLSGTLWSLGFLVYLFKYLPILTKARIDGRPG